MKVINWIHFFENKEKSDKFLRDIYGENYLYIDAKKNDILDVLSLHERLFGDEKVIIIRNPGRINLMGRHIDHQGGCVNLIAIDKEIFLTSALRSDHKIIAHNVEEERFPGINFDFSKTFKLIVDDWFEFIEDEEKMRILRSPNGHWENYFKAALFRLINLFHSLNLKGANYCVKGTIPIAAGISSSSALTMGVLESLAFWNNLNLTDNQIINLTAEAEWFTGTRGGAGDHIAIKKCLKNMVSQVKLFDFELLDIVPFPKELDILLVNSNVIADKSSGKRDQYNEKVLAYEIGFNLLKSKLPSDLKSKILYLRDINSETLSLKENEILTLLSELPEKISLEEVNSYLPDKWNEMRSKYAFKVKPKEIPVKEIITYGITECERSKNFIELLKQKDNKAIGEMMSISHDGDRVSHFSEFLEQKYHKNELNEDVNGQRIQNQVSNINPIPLFKRSGKYNCSIPEIDFIIDFAKTCEGVIGAQLSGAGLGGCAMILTKKGHTQTIISEIKEKFKNYFNKECTIHQVSPVNGSSLFIGESKEK